MKLSHSNSTLRAALLGSAFCLGTASASAQFSFQPSATLATPSNPDVTAAGDFDGDGDLDLATSADFADRVVVRFNAGDGTFGAPVSVATGGGTSPHGVTAGDFDGDGDVDLVVSLKGVGSVRTLVNGGTGTFALGASVGVGAEPRNVESADLDGDGDRDAAVVNRASNTVSVLLNQGAGSFTATSYPAGQDPRTLALADVTGDGRADLAVASHDTRQVIVLRNLGAGAFTGLVALSVGGDVRPEGVTIADLDGDGDGDVAASTGAPERVTVFLNAGTGSFGPAAHFATNGADGSFLVAADLDLDGDRDLAVADTGTNSVRVLANDGAGAFGAPSVVGVGAGPGHVLAADLDGNGGSDLVSTNDDGGSLSVLLNTNGGQGSATAYCVGARNSTGVGASIGHAGSLSVGANGFALTVANAVPNQFGVFFYGAQETQVPLGDGLRCVGGSLFRLQPATAIAADGSAVRQLDFTSPPAPAGQITAGSTWNFQFWYRDQAGPGGTGTNTSNALKVVFAP